MTAGGQWQQGQWQQGQPQDWQGQGWQQPPSQPYGQPPYGEPPAWPQQPYPQQQYGPQPGWPQQPPSLSPPVWPYGPGRPGPATAAAVLAIVTGALTVIGGLVFLAAGLTGDGDLSTWLLTLGVPVGVVLLVGGIGLLARRRAEWVLWSAVAAVGVLLLGLVGGLITLHDDQDAVNALLGFTIFAAPLPVVTASLSWQRTVRDWVRAGAFRG